MHKATKIFLIVVAVIVVIFAGWYGLESYAFNHPKITLYFTTAGEEGANLTVPQIDFQERSRWGVSDLWDDRFFEAYDIISEMISFAKSHDAPYEFDSRVEIIDGKTVFTIDGWYTENGERTEDSMTLSLDYVFTENIEEH